MLKPGDTRLGRPVAIKISAREFSDRFEREVVFLQNFFDELRRRVPVGR